MNSGNPWFYAAGGQQLGPVDDAALAGLVNGGTVGAATLVWRRGMPAWQTYAEVWQTLNAGVGSLAGPMLGANPAGGNGPATLTLAPTTATGAPALVPLTRCVECNGVFPAEDTVTLHEGPVCAGCKPIALQRLREGVPARTMLNLAGFWIRVGASTLDFFIKLPVTLGFQFVYYAVFASQLFSSESGEASVAPLIGAGLLNLLQIGFDRGYGWFFVGRFGATPGKMVCGLKVVRTDGSRVTYGRAFGRTMAKWLSALTLGIGYVLCAFDDQRRTLHDHLVDTRVVYK